MNDMTQVDAPAIQVLERALQLIRSGWNQRATALDLSGKCVWFTSPSAVSWCLVGALLKGIHDLSPGAPKGIFALCQSSAFQIVKSAVGCPLQTWNDEPGRARQDVILVLERAIKAA